MFKKIAPDKWKHFFVGILMGAVLQGACWHFLPRHSVLATLLAFILSWVIAYGFELFSLITGWGVYEVMDAIAGVLGAIIGIAGVLALTATVF